MEIQLRLVGHHRGVDAEELAALAGFGLFLTGYDGRDAMRSNY